jgi:hypothetical protein
MNNNDNIHLCLSMEATGRGNVEILLSPKEITIMIMTTTMIIMMTGRIDMKRRKVNTTTGRKVRHCISRE